jgi:hypothetical protein
VKTYKFNPILERKLARTLGLHLASRLRRTPPPALRSGRSSSSPISRYTATRSSTTPLPRYGPSTISAGGCGCGCGIRRGNS